jgi:Ca2+-transporting ATPase
MITGDHPRTAESIARELEMLEPGGEVVTGSEIAGLSKPELARRAERIRVVARATAADKLSLVEALSQHGHIVAMTGDGVNDAPAIKAAAIGVAMGRGASDVTREAADMVIYDGDYATIVKAIEEGRVIYSNIKRFIVFLFSVNAGLVLAVFAGALLGWPPLLTPTQILWINLITNGLPALALGMEPVHLDPMRDPPRRADESLISRRELAGIVAYGAVMALAGLYVFARHWNEASLAHARTMAFMVLALSPLFHSLNARSRRRSIFALGLLTNYRLLGAFAVALVLQAFAVYTPLGRRVFDTVTLDPGPVLEAMVAALSVWVVGELVKLAGAALRRSAREDLQ